MKDNIYALFLTSQLKNISKPIIYYAQQKKTLKSDYYYRISFYSINTLRFHKKLYNSNSERLCRSVFLGFMQRKQHKAFNLHHLQPCRLFRDEAFFRQIEQRIFPPYFAESRWRVFLKLY